MSILPQGNALVNAATFPSYMTSPPLHPPLADVTAANNLSQEEENSNAAPSLTTSKLLSNLLNEGSEGSA